MSHARCLVHAPILVSIVVLLTASIAAAADGVSSPVVRLYDGGAADPATRRAALQTAAALLSDSGLTLPWLDCTPDEGKRRCLSGREPGDLIIRILPASVGETPILGLALVDASSGAGVLATIYMDRVRVTAKRAGIEPAILLGRVMAHEIGHLLGVRGHARTGLMRERWTDQELARGGDEHWLLHADEDMADKARGTSQSRSPSHVHSPIQVLAPAAEAGDLERAR